VKFFYLIALPTMAAGMILQAQTNVTAIPPPRAPTLINSVSADFDLTARRAVYRGNVRVDDPQMKLTCEELTADLPQSGGHINHLVALTNVVVDFIDQKGQTNHVTSARMVYDYKVVNAVTNETVTWTGNAKVENAQGWLTGEPIVWDRANNSIHAENQKMILRQTITTELVNTNAPVIKTNLPARTMDLPTTKTNFPPGTIQNIDRINNTQTQ
jgi:lipopolysaccharide transport protein LptA